MKDAEKLASFVVTVTNGALSSSAGLQLKMRVLDSLGCAIGALSSRVINCNTNGAPSILVNQFEVRYSLHRGNPLVQRSANCKS